MTRKRPWVVLGALTAVYLIAVGVLTGVVRERLRVDRLRDNIVRTLGEAMRRVRPLATLWERDLQPRIQADGPVASNAARPATWASHLEVADIALSRGEMKSAERAWRDAHAAALRTREWRPLVAVGDTAIRIGNAAENPRAGSGRARKAYMDALTRARAHHSATGVLRVAVAFHRLGDEKLVEQCLVIAEGLGVRDAEGVALLRALALRAHNLNAAPTLA